MKREDLIQVDHLCNQYKVEVSFFTELQDFGFVEIVTLEDTYFIHEERLHVIEKIVRIHNDLNINLEGIDVVLNLLDKIDELQDELTTVKNRLSLYEGD